MHAIIVNVLEGFLTLFLAVLSASTPIIVPKILGWLKLSGDDKARQALETAITNGIALAQSRVNQQVSQGTVLSPEQTTAQVVAGARAYAEPKVPDAIKRLGVSDHLDEVIEARVVAPKPDATVALVPSGGAGGGP